MLRTCPTGAGGMGGRAEGGCTVDYFRLGRIWRVEEGAWSCKFGERVAECRTARRASRCCEELDIPCPGYPPSLPQSYPPNCPLSSLHRSAWPNSKVLAMPFYRGSRYIPTSLRRTHQTLYLTDLTLPYLLLTACSLTTYFACLILTGLPDLILPATLSSSLLSQNKRPHIHTSIHPSIHTHPYPVH
jgi:hypothetical protein